MLTYAVFFRKQGLRLIQQLIRPPVYPLNQLFLPLNSIYHFIENDPNEIGVLEDETVVQNIHGITLVDHVEQHLGETLKGKATLMPLPVQPLITQYFTEHKSFKRLNNNLGLLKNPKTTMLVSYNLIARRYRYMNNYLNPYFQWVNLMNTFCKKVEMIASESDRNQFFLFNLPSQLPPISLLNRSKDMESRQMLDNFGTDELRFIAELWHWLGKDRESHSILNTIPKNALSKLNLIVVYGGVFTVINLGVLDIWRGDGSNDKRAPGFTKVPAEVLQKRFLRMLMAIIETGTVSSDSIAKDEVEEEVVVEPNGDEYEEVEKEGGVKLADYDMSLTPNATASNKEMGVKNAAGKSLTDIIKSGVGDVKELSDDGLLEELPTYSDDDIEKDLAQLEVLNEANTKVLMDTYKPYTPPIDTLESGIEDTANKMAKIGMLSAAEHRRMLKLGSKYRTLKNPHTGEGSLADLTVITKEELTVTEDTPILPEVPGVLHKSMLSSSLTKFDSNYIREVLPKDIGCMVMGLQKAGIAVTDYNIQKVDDYTDAYDIHIIKVVPVVGKPTTLRFQLPRVNENGTFKASGVKYRMRKQRGDCPIRKTAPSKVALTSYYSKMFVVRSDRAVFNYPDWLVNNIVSRGIDINDESVMDIRMSKTFRHDKPVPRTYSTIAMRVAGFNSGPYRFYFDYAKMDSIFGEDVVKTIMQPGTRSANLKIPVGKKGNDIVLVMDYKTNHIHEVNTKIKTERVDLGTIEDILGLPAAKKPVEVAEVDIFGKTIPVGFLLAYHVGLGNLMASVNVQPRRVKTGSSYNLQAHEFIVKFEDEALIFDKRDHLSSMLFGGFNRYHRDIKRYSVYAFDKKDVYGNVLDSNDIGSRHIREFELMFKMWIDPITKGLLEEMNEPTDLFNLFISAVKKLDTDEHPAEMDTRYMRDKGYERFSGAVYFELVKAMRSYNAKPANVNASLDLNPQAVWFNIVQDQSVMPIEESNPIHALKEQEVVVYSGTGGRSGRSMTEKQRGFHKSNIGLVSEATVDSGDVATITYLTADPNYTSLRGTSRQMDEKDLVEKSAKVVSTSMLLHPGSDREDAKRTNFTSVQNSQTTHCVASTPVPLRTGYERIIGHRSSELFAKTARTDGTVEIVTDKTITVKYKDGQIAQYEIGNQYGLWAGHVVPHRIVTPLKVGQKVKQGNVLLFNTRYFTQDTLDPTQILPRAGVMAKTVLMESTDTLEDSSALSVEFSKKLVTDTTHVRSVKVKFDQEVRNLLKVGEEVDAEGILCTIHNSSSGNTDIFDEASLDTLSVISSATPRAKSSGVIEKIEVLYTGDYEDMSTTIRHLVEKSDSEIRRLNKELGKKAIDGRVDVGYRVDGQPLELDCAVIRVYITGPTGMGVGDKLVFGNQMKSVVARIMGGVNETENGEAIDAIFGYQSIANRIVLSCELIGTTSSLLMHIGKLAVNAYKAK